MPPVYQETRPPERLAPFVECFWTLRAERGLNGYLILPDGCLDIVFRPQGLDLIGPMTVPRAYDFSAGTRLVGVRFRPALAGTFLPGLAPMLVDSAAPLEDVWGGRARVLMERIAEARTACEACRALAGALPLAGPTGPALRALTALAASHGRASLDGLARQANLSLRQFRRRAIEASGYSPKHLARVLRFRRASGLIASGRRDYAALAADCGYYDQAHLIADFREFAGMTPVEYAAYRQGRSPTCPNLATSR